MNDSHPGSNLRELAAVIVSSYVTHNSLRCQDLPGLISVIHGALAGLGQPAAEPNVEADAERSPRPVSIKKSVHPDDLISMEDGKQYQSLKRHLAHRGLLPIEYRAKWGLPDDYPMTASGYSERRSAIAKSLGLGRKRAGVSGDGQVRVAEKATVGDAFVETPTVTKTGKRSAKMVVGAT